MSITKADILAYCQDRLRKPSLTDANILTHLRATLKHISMAGYFLEESYTSATLAEDDYEITIPPDFGFLQHLYVYKSADTEPDPLEPLVGGYPPNPTNGNPAEYREFNGKLQVFPPADDDYLVKLDYGQVHPDDVDDILFTDKFRPAINYLTASKVADRYDLGQRASTLYGMYLIELGLLKDTEKSLIRITRHRDL